MASMWSAAARSRKPGASTLLRKAHGDFVMGENSKIEWCHHTFNPWLGCAKLSRACDNCYAEKERAVTCLGVTWGAGQDRHRTAASTWKQPLAWDRKAAKEGRRARVFCASLADVFDAEVSDAWRDELFALIAVTPNLDWLLLTKRPKVAREYVKCIVESRGDTESGAFDKAVQAYLSADQGSLPSASHVAGGSVYHSNWTYLGHDPGHWEYDLTWPLPNAWLGVTVEDQKMDDMRIPLLLDTPAVTRFISMEPLLAAVDLEPYLTSCEGCGNQGSQGYLVGYDQHAESLCGKACSRSVIGGEGPSIDWVITGGESGPNARPAHPDWFRDIRDQCAAAGVPFLFKQWGEWAPVGDFPDRIPSGKRHDFGDDTLDDDRSVWRVGKKAAGRLLDGVEHSGFPQTGTGGA